jgi:hypothetical protein
LQRILQYREVIAMKYEHVIFFLMVIIGLFFMPAIGETQTDSLGPEWGTSFTACKSMPAATFTPADSSTTWSGFEGWVYRTGGDNIFSANVDLPTGAKVWNIYATVFDTSATGDIWVWFNVCPADNAAECTVYPQDNSLRSSGSPGFARLYSSLSVQNITVDNLNKSYYVLVQLADPTLSNSFRSVQVCYVLQISPAPSTPTFTDVPASHLLFQYIEALAASGITTGYDDDTFRPSQYITRGQMAVFLSRALGLHWPH